MASSVDSSFFVFVFVCFGFLLSFAVSAPGAVLKKQKLFLKLPKVCMCNLSQKARAYGANLPLHLLKAVELGGQHFLR